MKKFLTIAVCSLLLFACNGKKDEKDKDKDAMSADNKDKAIPQSEFADAKYTDWGKKMIGQFASGDITGWMGMYADNAVYQWSAGDSLAGKAAIDKYWQDRRKNVIDSITFSNDIWIPLKVNTPQRGPDATGIWLLSWYQINVRYKNGKNLQMWSHVDYHFDANDKIDRAIQYIDRAPINAATAGIK